MNTDSKLSWWSYMVNTHFTLSINAHLSPLGNQIFTFISHSADVKAVEGDVTHPLHLNGESMNQIHWLLALYILCALFGSVLGVMCADHTAIAVHILTSHCNIVSFMFKDFCFCWHVCCWETDANASWSFHLFLLQVNVLFSISIFFLYIWALQWSRVVSNKKYPPAEQHRFRKFL